MKFHLIYKLSFLLLVFAFIGCERDEDPLGPDTKAASDDFQITNCGSFDRSADGHNFKNGPVDFNAEFNERVSWEISIKAQQSGAVKTINGKSKKLSAANASWNGSHDELFFFKEGDTCLVTLKPYGADKVCSDTIIVDSTAGPDELTTTDYIFPGSGFEDGYGNNEFFPSDDPRVNTEADIRTSSGVPEGSNIPEPPQGKHFFHFIGSNPDDVFIGGIRYHRPGFTKAWYAECFDKFWDLPKDPEKIWINLYVYGTGADNVQINVEAREADSVNLPKTKIDKCYNQGETDDSNGHQIFPDHKGWKLYSFKYSALDPSGSAKDGGSGNQVLEPDRVTAFQIGFLTTLDSKGKTIETAIDYPIITIGGPFNPSKK